MASKFTQRHYEDIAQTLHECVEYEDCYAETMEKIADRFVYLFETDNARFNANKFRDAVRDGVKNYYARR